MKNAFGGMLLLLSMLCNSATSCNRMDSFIQPANIGENNSNENMVSNRIIIRIGAKSFAATLLDNSTAKVFKQMLPLIINMKELNGNEKYGDLPKSLTANSSNPGTIHNGDLMLYGSNTLVVFYKTFSTSYNYTKLGVIDDAADLASALGGGNVSVTFELQK